MLAFLLGGRSRRRGSVVIMYSAAQRIIFSGIARSGVCICIA